MDGTTSQTKETIGLRLSNNNNAHILLNFSDDDMFVSADFIPAVKDGNPLSKEYIGAVLEKFGVTEGVNMPVMLGAMERCNATRRIIKNVPAAIGTPPVDETFAHFEVEKRLTDRPRLQADENSKADYRSYSPYTVVQAGEVLARLTEAVSGRPGKTVHGTEIPFKSITKPGVSGGANTETREKEIAALAGGLFIFEKNTIRIETSLVIKGAVAYGTGDINFPGDVKMEGTVNENFKVEVGGNLTVEKTLDVTDLIVRGSLNVTGGMVGRGHSLAKVNGTVNARFIQSCRLACKSTVTVKNEIINSTVYTMDKIDAGDKGTIMAGEFFAFNGIRAGQIGKEHGAPTKLHIGTNWTLTQEMEANGNTLRILGAKLEKVNAYLGIENLERPKMLKLGEMKIRLESEIKKCREKQAAFEKRFIVAPDASIQCFGAIAKGTVIDICGVEYTVNDPLFRIRLILNKDNKRIAVTAI